MTAGRILIALLLPTPAILAGEMTATRPDGRSGIIAVGAEKQLFIDDLFILAPRNITLRVHPPRKTGEMTLRADRPWESMTLNWFTVMDDSGKCRMWYECYDVDGWFGNDDTSFCYAESDDGINWRKPELGLFTYKNNSRNNILFRMLGPENGHSRVHGTHVFRDPTAQGDTRYKAVSQGIWTALNPPHRITGMVSADGLSWKRCPEPICTRPADSQYSGFWDDRLNKYVLYGRVGGRGRAVGRSESSDFRHFDDLQLALQTDEDDLPDSDFYNPAAMKYPFAANVYLMFPSLYDHKTQELDIRLAVSRDGIRWSRPQRTAFVPLGRPGEFDSGSLYMGQGLIRRENELWLYYSGSAMRHDQVEFENRNKPGFERIYSRVISRLDGFVSAEAGKEVGRFVTPLMTFAGRVLRLNVEVRKGGSLRVGLIDEQDRAIQDRTVEDCVPVVGDSISTIVRWNNGHDLSSWAGKPVKLRVEMSNTSLFAFQFAQS